jgi:dihydrofolate reductase
MIEMIWAMDENWLIGKTINYLGIIHQILKYFWEMANDRIVVCGRLTYLSLTTIFKKEKHIDLKKYM